MKNFIIGILGVLSVLSAAMFHAKASVMSLINVEGILVVIGGTISISILNSRFHDLFYLFRRFLRLIRTQDNKRRLQDALLTVTKQLEQGKVPKKSGFGVIDQAVEWIGAGLKGPEFEKLMRELTQVRIERDYACASILQNLSKYPPALGMIGTVIGIVSIFQNLNSESGQASLGQNLGVAMSSTLYGLVLANFFINPIAELLMQSIYKGEEDLELIVETAMMWANKENAYYIQEHIQLYDAA